jgi:diaminopimelate decarboxylase
MTERLRAPAREAPAPSPAPVPWPASSHVGPAGLEVGGLSMEDLAARFGTPLLVVDEEDLRVRCRRAAAAAPRALFAVKAFTSHAVIRIALEEGLDLLTATGGEVQACLRAGAPAARIVLHGNNKSDDELMLAVRAGLSLVVADGLDELSRLDAIARKQDRVQPVLLRVIPDVSVQTHEAIATGQEASKFGTPLAEVAAAARAAAALPNVRLDGLHAHIGSQVQVVEPYLRALDVLLDLAAQLSREGLHLPTLDLGGGYAVTYVGEAGLAPSDVAGVLAARLRDRCGALDLPIPQLVVEPGRSIVANAVVTIYRVGGVKRTGGRVFAAVDGGMSDNLRPMLYGARFTVTTAGTLRSGRSEEPVTVVGKHCESGDVLAPDVPLPADLRRGDLLAFAATGAYTYGMASVYNRVGRPAVVGVRDGTATLWLRREDAADMDRLETGAFRVRSVRASVPEGVTLRPASPADAGPFMTFWGAIVAEGRHVRSERVSHPARVYRRRFRRSWTDREAQIVAVEGDRLVGHVFIQRETHPVTRHVATLGIAVAADRRGEGVGSALMAEAMRWAGGAGVEKLVLSVYPHNTGAIALYRKFGFVDEGRLARQSHKSYGYEDEILMGAWIGTGRDEGSRPR